MAKRIVVKPLRVGGGADRDQVLDAESTRPRPVDLGVDPGSSRGVIRARLSAVSGVRNLWP